ncbi:MAG: hypothetical protein Q3962_04420 [Corynebacterium sp.]|nr:hypothetical protein [Corynebacterium sp.]
MRLLRTRRAIPILVTLITLAGLITAAPRALADDATTNPLVASLVNTYDKGYKRDDSNRLSLDVSLVDGDTSAISAASSLGEITYQDPNLYFFVISISEENLPALFSLDGISSITPHYIPSPVEPAEVETSDALSLRTNATPSTSAACTNPNDTKALNAWGRTIANTLGVADSATSFDGTGIKVGIISDSFNANGGAASDVAKNALPGSACGHNEVTVLSDNQNSTNATYTDEGRAMAQVLYQVAPGADIYFAGVKGGTTSAIKSAAQTLANAGVDIIVDDVAAGDELVYQKSDLSSYIDSLTAKGVIYLSAAGNSSAQSRTTGTSSSIGGWQTTQYRGTTCPGFASDLSGVDCMSFTTDNGAQNYDAIDFAAYNSASTFSFSAVNSIAIPRAYTTLNQAYRYLGGYASRWSTPTYPTFSVGYYAELADGTIDQICEVDLNAYTPALTTNCAANLQDLQAASSGGYYSTYTIYMVIARTNSSRSYTAPAIFSTLSSGSAYPTDRDAIASSTDSLGATAYGHTNDGSSISVGAVTPSNPSTIEYFSSYGNPTLYFGAVPASGSQGNTTRQTTNVGNKPDIFGVDGGYTSFFGSNNQFFGTSSAAPSVAGIVARLKQADSSLNQDSVRELLQNTSNKSIRYGYDATGFTMTGGRVDYAATGLTNAAWSPKTTMTSTADATSMTVTLANKGTSDTYQLAFPNGPTVTIKGTTPANTTTNTTNDISYAVTTNSDGNSVVTFTGLNANTQYTVNLTVTNADNSSLTVTGTTTATTSLESAPAATDAYSINYADETISIHDGYQVSTSQDFSTTLTNGASITPGTTLYYRKVRTQNGTTTATSQTAQQQLPQRPTVSVPSATADTDDTDADGTNADSVTYTFTVSDDNTSSGTNNSATIEYRVDGVTIAGDTYTAPRGASFTVQARIAATDDSFASEWSRTRTVSVPTNQERATTPTTGAQQVAGTTTTPESPSTAADNPSTTAQNPSTTTSKETSQVETASPESSATSQEPSTSAQQNASAESSEATDESEPSSSTDEGTSTEPSSNTTDSEEPTTTNNAFNGQGNDDTATSPVKNLLAGSSIGRILLIILILLGGTGAAIFGAWQQHLI